LSFWWAYEEVYEELKRILKLAVDDQCKNEFIGIQKYM
jgi:hypothetical protein